MTNYLIHQPADFPPGYGFAIVGELGGAVYVPVEIGHDGSVRVIATQIERAQDGTPHRALAGYDREELARQACEADRAVRIQQQWPAEREGTW